MFLNQATPSTATSGNAPDNSPSISDSLTPRTRTHSDAYQPVPDEPEGANDLTPAQQIYAQLGLNPAPDQQVSQFHEMPEEQRSAVLMSTMTAVIQRVDTISRAQTTNGSSVPLSQADQIRLFHYGGPVKELMRRAAKTAFLEGDLASYLDDSRPRSLFRLVMAEIRRQPESYLATHFPPGFVAGEGHALAHCHREVKRQLKNVRHQVRNLLLVGVVVGSAPEAPAIPNLTDMVRDLWRWLMVYPSGVSDADVDRRVPPLLKIRFAYLRLATLQNFLDPLARNLSQWEVIDARLRDNLALTVNFTNS
ncbi:hypothetical protein PGT21_020825 [Puccinia graminis f. sp. tritici]|uniref:Uncharacterized protein n=1 Tax=Puccinia graminis f. sp. tritici TaxID=56615 RepID=A0A5B0QB78_PUCGR|nr:hypothetical protein PGT21_020825 [Puccinia graminis f. sp. tritici]